MRFSFLFFILICSFSALFAQTATIKGRVIDPQNKAIVGAEIKQAEANITVFSDEEGRYAITLPVTSPRKVRIRFTHFVHDTAYLELEIKSGYVYDQYMKMEEFSSKDVNIIGKTPIRPQMQIIPINVKEMSKMPSINPSVEDIVIRMPGVAGVSEFSSQYRVRGGNFDENLVYVNGIEVYRPFLARSGQMEGLGFANRSMTENIAFSTGGFTAQYGDKLSSVLDVTYRQPKSFAGSAELGVITNSLHLEGISKNKKNPEELGKFTYLMGARYFSLAYLLNSLQTKGNYKPRFVDLQGMFTYTPKRRFKPEKIYTRRDGTQDTLNYPLEPLKFTAFITGANNRFLFTPTYGESSFGTVTTPLRLTTAFEGKEQSSYTTTVAALMAEHSPYIGLKYQYILSAFRTEESEIFDVEGGYRLSELNNNLASEEFGQESYVLGTGSIFRSARNYLTVTVLSGEMKGEYLHKNNRNHKLYWGGKYERHFVSDQIKEYNLFDSADYVVNNNYQFGVTEYIKGSTSFQRNMLRFYVQEEWNFGKKKAAMLTYGLRMTYDDKIKVLMPSPRAQFLYDFSKINQALKLKLRLATGVYNQPPFYREFRKHDGTLNTNLTPQTSVHFIGGIDYTFNAWGRNFALFSEAYYKYLYNVIPYEVQNVRLRYFPEQQLPGYAYGLDARISGEFIKGVDSWASVSYLKTQERLSDTSSIMISRPSDQRFTFSMYFQDELPINPTYKVHVNYVFGSGTRTGIPGDFLTRTKITYPAYHRVDIGFSKMLVYKSPEQVRNKKHALSSLWVTLEIYNLFGRFNTVGYEWVKDFDNHQFAVPQYLSARLLNLRAVVNFK